MTKYKRYAQLKAERAKIDEQLALLNPGILKAMGDQDTISNGFGKFTKVYRKTYSFSNKFLSFERKMKGKIQEKKYKEIENGASWQEAMSLRYDFPKALIN